MRTGTQRALIGPHVPIPDRLLRQAEPETIGLYVLVARLFLDHGAPVPLSSRDVSVWLYGNTDHAARRRFLTGFQRLTDLGYLTAITTGRKHAFAPSWGRGRDGSAQSWDAAQPQYGRPRSVTYRPFPIDLLDLAVGRWIPRAGCRTAVTRCLSALLLDARDIGTYALAQLVPTALTPRLVLLGSSQPPHHAALHAAAVLACARAGTLTTLNDAGETLPVTVVAAAVDHDWIGAGSRSDRRSRVLRHHAPSQQNAVATSSNSEVLPTHVHVDAHEVTNQSTPPNPVTALPQGGGAALATGHARALDSAVVTNHESLNPSRSIGQAEWNEIAAIQESHGVATLCLWQERALRATPVRTRGLYPGYYRRCAALHVQQISDAPLAPANADVEPETTRGNVPRLRSATRAALAQLVTVLGEPIRRPERLAAIEPTLILDWAAVAQHVGLRRWRDPAAWLLSEIARGHAPPDLATLDRWARQLPWEQPDWRALAAAYALEHADGIDDTVDALASDAVVWELLDATLPAAAQALVERCDVALDGDGAIIGYDDPSLADFAHQLAAVLCDILLDCARPHRVRVFATRSPAPLITIVLDDTMFTLQQEYFAYNTKLANPKAVCTEGAADVTPHPHVAQDATQPPVSAGTDGLCVEAIAPPSGCDAVLWAALGPVAQAAVRVGNWRALVRLVGNDRAASFAPAEAIDVLPVLRPGRTARVDHATHTRPPAWRDELAGQACALRADEVDVVRPL